MHKEHIPRSFSFGSVGQERRRASPRQSHSVSSPFVPQRIDDVASQPRRNSSFVTSPGISPLSPRVSSAMPSSPSRPLLQAAAEPKKARDPRTLLKEVTSLVKTRSGSVLSRNTILKMDHFPRGTNTKLDYHLQGAPNFRSAELDVYGVAQPTVIGLSTALALLSCHPKSLKEDSCTWFLTREEPLLYLNGHPHVLRDYADPMQTMSTFLGMNAERLEAAEERLKKDVIEEAKSKGGLLLVHQELDDGAIVPCYVAADSVQTPSEVFREFQEKGFRLKYFRIPISPMQSPEDNYFDEYVRVIKTLKPTDPLIFNCGMGGVRTTVGMIIAQIIRRTQLIAAGNPDPFPIPGYTYSFSEAPHSPMSPDFIRGLGEIDSAHAQNHALLRLVHVLEMGLDSKMSSRSAIEWTLERGPLIANLKEAIMGNYQSIVSLTAALENGTYCKRMLDEIVDRSDAVVNIREDILMHRIRQTTKSSSEHGGKKLHLSTALAGLQRYFFLLCFTSYINGSADTKFETRFSSWVKERTEVWLMLRNMRNKGPRYDLFRPVDDLRIMNANRNGATSVSSYRRGSMGMFDMVGAGAQSGIVEGEVEEYILQARTGVVLTSQTILKIDFWRRSQLDNDDSEQLSTVSTPHGGPEESESTDSDSSYKALKHSTQMHHTFFIEGASNFRRIKHTHVYGVAQPTIDGLQKVIRRLLTDQQRPNGKILWLNLREEPIIYINGIPYVLRDRYFTLRNIRAYKGITGTRLEQIEERLKHDVLREVRSYDGWIMLHGEDTNGNVQAAWEEVAPADVLTVREVMDLVAKEVCEDMSMSSDVPPTQEAASLEYHRTPITAEKAPQLDDFDELRQLIARVNLSNTAIILNCQIGVGRSTVGTVIATLLTRWMTSAPSISQSSDSLHNLRGEKRYLNYQIINSLLRVIKNGLENKCAVDDAVDKCGAFLNVREVVESMYVMVENETDEAKRSRLVKRGVIALERYFLLICFQAYLDSTSPDTLEKTESFSKWMERHQEMKSILLELRRDDMGLIVPVDNSVGDGVALSSEVMDVVNARRGQVLAQQTILKHDAFPGCQKIGLKEKIDGAYNYRRVEIKGVKRAVVYGGLAATESGLAAELQQDDDEAPQPPFICGCAMPSKDGIRSVLRTMGAGPGGKRKVLWTCLREEPVIYINKQPYVLRLFSDPIKNLETTGIARERVEGMEERMKLDVLQELQTYCGRLLLHDEEADEKGGFPLVAVWETVPVEYVETPKEVFQSIVKEGYQVDYLRIPITDEQAPIPDVFDQLISRISEASVEGVPTDGEKDTSKGVDVLFNCQMGRGRTTTGMVTACLMAMILNNDTEADMSSSFIADTPDNLQRELYDGDNDESHEERERYENGEYKIILQLVSVLTYGKLAKRLTDQAINMCDHMQNLRKAVYDYKLRLESVEDRRGPKWRATQEAALNYLVRYFYLIVFANYLLEDKMVSEEDTSRTTTTFKAWLKHRREITNILKLQSVDLC